MLFYILVFSVLSTKKCVVEKNHKITKWRLAICINDLVSAFAVKVAILFYDAALSAKRYDLAMSFHYFSSSLYGINYIKVLLIINIL